MQQEKNVIVISARSLSSLVKTRFDSLLREVGGRSIVKWHEFDGTRRADVVVRDADHDSVDESTVTIFIDHAGHVARSPQPLWLKPDFRIRTLMDTLDLAAVKVMNQWDAKLRTAGTPVRASNSNSVEVFRLRHWPVSGDRPLDRRYLRVLSAMTERWVSRNWMTSFCRLDGSEVDDLLIMAQKAAALETGRQESKTQKRIQGFPTVAMSVADRFRTWIKSRAAPSEGPVPPATPRIVLLGPMGVGKTTAIRSLCGDAAVDCDVDNLDTERHSKPTTTVGADFGLVELAAGRMLHIYGGPGQDRFGFLRRWLLEGAVGVMVLVDPEAPDSIAHAASTVREAREVVDGIAVVVVLARPVADAWTQDASRELARRLNEAVPVLRVDVRDGGQVRHALDLLVELLSVEDPS